MSNPYSKGDIDVQKIKVKKTQFLNFQLGHMSISAYIFTIFISMYRVLY